MTLKTLFSDQYIIITGGCGFIGSCTLRYLNDLGVENIIVVDDFDATEKWKNLVGKKYADYISRNELMQFLKENKEQVGAILHIGAIADTTLCDGSMFYKENYRYSVDLAKFAIDSNIRFVYASSAATYGSTCSDSSDEHNLLDSFVPLNMYAQSKQMFDLWLLRKNYLDKVVGLKFFNVYGPNENHKGQMASMVYHLFHQIKNTKRARLFKSNDSSLGDGEQKRDFVYVKDVVAVIVNFLLTKECGIFNVGSGNARSFNDLAAIVFESLKQEQNIEYFSMPKSLSLNYQNFTQACLRKMNALDAVEDVSFSIKTSLEEGARDYILNYLNKGGAKW